MKESNNFYKLKKISTAILTLLIIVSFFPQIIASTQNDTNTIKTNNLLNNQLEKNIKLGSYNTFNKLLNRFLIIERILSLPIFNKIINSKLNNINTDNNPGSFSSDRCELCLTKEADSPNACVGDTITYTYNLTNCVGGLALYCVSITDDKLGIILEDTTLEAYETITVTKTYTVQESDLPGPIINTATAIGYEPTCTHIEATTTATETVQLTCEPCINLSKEADVDSACVDDVITYTFTVENCGDLTLYDVDVMDDKLGPITLGDTTLDPDETTTGTATYTVTENDCPDPIINTAIATGTPPYGENVTDTDSETVTLLCCECEETVWIDDNFTPDTPDWLITHFNIKQLALDHLESGGTAIVYEGIYHENILIDDIPCCDNTGITQKGEYGCFPIDESAIIDGSETIKVNNVTIKYLEYTPNLDGSIIIFPDICGTILRCNKFNKDCYNEAIGVLSRSNCGVNARLNWWGAPDGPQGGYMDDGLIANGEGVKVIGLVDVEPWIGIHAEINQPPDPTTIKLGGPIHFDATGSWAYTYGECCQNPKELPLQYLWDFGDGRLSPNKSPIHIYTEPGTYEVTLTVDAPGIPGLYPNIMFDWAYVTIHVTTENTTLTCNADGGNLGGYETIINEPLQLIGDAYGGNGEYTWHWNFGDKTSDSNQQNPIHTYTKPGTYTAKLTVTSAGKTATDTTQVTVYDIDELFININDANAIVGIETLFTATIKGGIPPYTINWDFGDQKTSQENNPTHIYNSPGVYTITVTVTDNRQKTATDTATITVEEQKIIQPAEIKQVQGGLGIKATINAGDNECYWEIIITGKYILSGGHKTGTINPNEQQIIKLGYSTRAYGKVYITVKAEDTTKEYKAFSLGPFFLNLKQL